MGLMGSARQPGSVMGVRLGFRILSNVCGNGVNTAHSSFPHLNQKPEKHDGLNHERVRDSSNLCLSLLLDDKLLQSVVG